MNRIIGIYCLFVSCLAIPGAVFGQINTYPATEQDSIPINTENLKDSVCVSEENLHHNLQWVKKIHDDFEHLWHQPQMVIIHDVFHTIERRPITVFLVALILLFVINVSFIVISMFLTLLVKNSRRKIRALITTELENRLTEIMFDDDFDEEAWYATAKLTKLHKRLLIDVLYTYQLNITGEYLNKVYEVYSRLRLYRYSVHKLRYGSSSHRVMGIRELVRLYPSDAWIYLLPYLVDKDDIVRGEIQIGLALLDENAEMDFLGRIKRSFSKWSQLNVVASWQARGLDLPSLGPWLKSDVRDIRIFAIRGITYIQQIENVDLLLPLLDTDDEEVRFYIYQAFVEFAYAPGMETAKLAFENESVRNQSVILQFFSVLDEFNDFDFLLPIIKGDNFELRMEACRTLLSLGEEGENYLSNLNVEMDNVLDMHLLHLKGEKSL